MPKPTEQPNETPTAKKKADQAKEVLKRASAAQAQIGKTADVKRSAIERLSVTAGATSSSKRRVIESALKSMAPEQTENFLRTACDTHLEPGLSDEAFTAFVKKCTHKALDVLRERLAARGSEKGLARLQATRDAVAAEAVAAAEAVEAERV